PAARLGLGYRFSAIQHLVRATGVANALEIMLTAKRMTAMQAQQRGLLHAVVKDDQLDEKIQDYLSMIDANAPLTMNAAKSMINALADQREGVDMELMSSLMRECYAS